MSYHEDRLKRKNGILPPLPTRKEKKPLNKVSPNKQKELKGDDALDEFFELMKERLKGKCEFCGGRTTWKNKGLWRIAIAHLLPKAKFKSVATDIDNWVELCWDCHASFDNGKISWEMLFDSQEWLMLRARLRYVLPKIKEEERKNKLYSKLEELIKK